MQVDRRTVLLGASASFLSACGGGTVTAPSSREPQLKSVPNAGYDQWVASFKSRATGRGISQATLDRAFRGAGYLPGVIKASW